VRLGWSSVRAAARTLFQPSIYEVISNVSALQMDVPLIVSVSTQLSLDVAADADCLCDGAALLRDAIKFTLY